MGKNPSGIPADYEPSDKQYKLTTEQYYYKKLKPMKGKLAKAKPYVQDVRIVSDKTK